MNAPRDETAPSERTEAAVRHSRWPGWIWLVPLAALGVLIWLGIRFFFSHGTTVTVYFDKAPGISPENTHVEYRGVQIGVVTGVNLTTDGRWVALTLAMQRSVRQYLRSGTRFWLQGVSTDLSDLPSLMSIIGGPSVEMEPGPGKPQSSFFGLEKAPAFTEPTAGTLFALYSTTHGAIVPGTGVYYLGLQVGKVTDVQLLGPHRFRISVLVRAPYDRLVHAGSRFWDAGALELSTSNGLKLQLLSVGSLIHGAVAFDTPLQAASTAPSVPGTQFTLYPDQGSAERSARGPLVLYQVRFPGAVGGLPVGAPVKLHDFVIGEVRAVGFDFDPQSGAVRTPVTIALDTSRLHIAGGATPTHTVAGAGQGVAGVDTEQRRLADAITRLVRTGLRARLAQEPPLVGPYYVSLDLVPHAAPAMINVHTMPPSLPAAPGGGLDSFATKLGQLPLQQIGENVRAITARIRSLVSSPQLSDSLHHLDDTMQGIDTMVQQVKPQVPQIVASLRRAADQMDGIADAAHEAIGGPDVQGGLTQTADEVTRAARSVRSLADYLERHPEALIRGKQP